MVKIGPCRKKTLEIGRNSFIFNNPRSSILPGSAPDPYFQICPSSMFWRKHDFLGCYLR